MSKVTETGPRMTTDEARAVFDKAYAASTDPDARARIELCRAYFTDPAARVKIADYVYSLNQESGR